VTSRRRNTSAREDQTNRVMVNAVLTTVVSTITLATDPLAMERRSEIKVSR